MKRSDLQMVNALHGRLSHFERGLKALRESQHRSPVLSIRAGSDDKETGIYLSRKRVLSLLQDEIDEIWSELRSYGVEPDPEKDEKETE